MIQLVKARRATGNGKGNGKGKQGTSSFGSITSLASLTSFTPFITGVTIAVVSMTTTGCEKLTQGEIPLPTYQRPVVSEAGRTCDDAARMTGGAHWADAVPMVIAPGSTLWVGDPSVMGGPFEPPLAIVLPAGAVVSNALAERTIGPEAHVLVGPAPANRPLCAQIRWHPRVITGWKPAGNVTIDTEILAVVDSAAYLAMAKRSAALVVTTIDGVATDLNHLAPELARQGLPTERILPTLLRGVQPARSGDAELIATVAKRLDVTAKSSPEPASPAWPFLRCLGEAPSAGVPLDAHATAISDAGDIKLVAGNAVAFEAPSGEGTFPVVIGMSDGDVPTAVEIRFTP